MLPNRRPVFISSTNGGFNVQGSSHYSSKTFDHYYRSGARLLEQRVKSHKLTSNASQVTFSFKFDTFAVPSLTPIVCDQQQCNTFQSNNIINILKHC